MTERDRTHGKASKKIILTSKRFEEHLFAGRNTQHSIYYLEPSFLDQIKMTKWIWPKLGSGYFNNFSSRPRPRPCGQIKSSLLFLNEAEAARPKLLFFENVVKCQKLNLLQSKSRQRPKSGLMNKVCHINYFFFYFWSNLSLFWWPYFDQVLKLMFLVVKF